jgi:hypothetical protein
LVGSVEDLILLRGGNAVTAGFVGEPFAEEVAALLEVRRSLVKHDGSFDDLLLGRVEFADLFSLAHRSLEVIDDGVAGVIEETGECGSEHGTGDIADSWEGIDKVLDNLVEERIVTGAGQSLGSLNRVAFGILKASQYSSRHDQ